MKKIFTLMAAMLLVPWVGWGQDSKPWTGEINTDWFDETQSELTITTAEQLAGLANISPSELKGKIIKLGNNIILNEGYENYQNWEDNSSDLREWPSINWETVDDLIFDGCGYEIKGAYIIINKRGYNNGYGLFSRVGSQSGQLSATIKNLKVTYSYINGSTAALNCSIGGIVGVLSMGTTISNCVFDGLIVIDENINHVGGICGSSNGNIENCCNKGDINLELKDISQDYIQKGIGGVCGNNMGMPIINCYNEGDITVEGSNNNIFTIEIGGIAGYSKEIYSCYNKGSISALVNNKTTNITSIGGIAGLSEKVSYCYNQGRITGDDTNTSEYYKVEDICGGYLLGLSISPTTFVKNYILSTSESTDGITSATAKQFESGEVAWNLRGPFTIDDETTILGFGQDLQDASITSPTLLAFTPGKEVYKLTLDYSGYNNEKQKEQFANSGFLNLPKLVATETEKEVGWYDNEGTLYTSTSAISDDITLYAKKQTLHNITIEATEGGSV